LLLEQKKEVEEDLHDESDMLLADQQRVSKMPLEPELAKMMVIWDLFAAVLKPWVDPPAGDAAERIEALEGHDSRVELWLAKRGEMGLYGNGDL
jgi:hypothetical protein